MVLTSGIPSADAEQATFLANELRSVGHVRSIARSRVARRMSNRESRLLIEMAVPRAIAIGENYLLVAAARLVKPSLLKTAPPPDPPDSDTRRLRNCAKSFSVLVSFWQSDLRVDLSSLPSWQDFEEYRDLRHVLVHRLGMWQPGLDRPHPKLTARLQRVASNPDAYRGEVPLVATDLENAIDAVLTVVTEADRRLPLGLSTGSPTTRASPRASPMPTHDSPRSGQGGHVG